MALAASTGEPGRKTRPRSRWEAASSRHAAAAAGAGGCPLRRRQARRDSRTTAGESSSRSAGSVQISQVQFAELLLDVPGVVCSEDGVGSVGRGSGDAACVLGGVMGSELGGDGEEFSPVVEEPMDLVGSNGNQPRPSKYSSGQACMLSVVTL